MIIFIRHAEKLFENGNSEQYALDPGITKEGAKKARIKFRNLIRQYGIPPQIISSPYLRTRQTALIAQKTIFDLTGIKTPIIYEPAIGEYLGFQKNINVHKDLLAQTLHLHPVTKETWKQYSKRIYDFTQYITDRSFDGWFISHGLVIQSISFFKGNKIEYPLALAGWALDQNEIILI